MCTQPDLAGVKKRRSRFLAARLWCVALAPIGAAIALPGSGRALVVATVVVCIMAFLTLPIVRAVYAALRFLARLFKAPLTEEMEGPDAGASDDAETVALAATEDAASPTTDQQLRQSLILAAIQMWTLAGIAIGTHLHVGALTWSVAQLIAFFLVMAFALAAPAVGFGLEAIRSRKMPPRPSGKPQHDHISGFGALLLVMAIVGIVALAALATTDRNINREIHAQWGAWIVFALIGLFLIAATVPSFGVPDWLNRVAGWSGRLLHPLGRSLSVADSVLVYCIAPAAGVTLKRRWLGRYAYLAAHLLPLGLMGYFLPAPFGLIPIAWSLVSAISISRRWSWVEDDRETAMLTAQFRSENLRVGFAQDLRDEALIAFTSMFILVPLALRQVQIWGDASGLTIFSITVPAREDLYMWIQYFGSELAKAVPFVDWAEIYDVEGDGPIEMKSELSRHVVFATRVLVDLVFLATLVQVLSTFARNAKQIEMFRKGEVDRFDPFIEGTQFQRLVVWNGSRWEPNATAVKTFGTRRKYNLTRLLELRDDKQAATQNQARVAGAQDRRLPQWAVWAAADLLYARDYQDGTVVAQLYEQLNDAAGAISGKAPNKDAIASILDELEKPNRARQIDDLDDVRFRLRRYVTSWPLRQRIVTLIARVDPDDDEDLGVLQTTALATTLADEKRLDSRAPIRRIAFDALKPAYLRGERSVIRAFQRAAEKDQSGALKSDILAFVQANPRTPTQDEIDLGPTA
jgi:hypothetical protein